MTLVQKEIKAVYLWENKVRPSIQPITTAWIYRNETDGLISLSSDGSTWITIADKNLWATTVYNSWDTMSESNCGKFYQRWNNYWFPFTWPTTTSTTQVNARYYWPNNYYSSSTFIKWANYQSSWDSSTNKNLRWWVTWTVTAMKWPCPSWFHVMSVDESDTLLLKRASIRWVTAEVIGNWHRITNSTDISNFLSDIKMPLCWSISWSGSKSTASWLWTSTYTASYSIYVVWLATSQITAKYNGDTSPNGEAIRPFKNEAVQPDDSRTKLY